MNINNVETNKITSYDTFLLCILVLSTLIGSNIIATIFQIALILKALCVKKVSIIGVKELIISALLGVEIALIIFPILYLFTYVILRNGRFKNYHKNYIVLIIYAFIVALISSVNEFLPLNLIAWVLIFSAPFCYYFYAIEYDGKKLENTNTLVFIEIIMFIEIGLILFQGIKGVGFQPSDLFIGTLNDAHKIGLLFFIFFFYGCYILKDTPNKLIGFMVIISALVVEYLSDSKAILLSAAIAVFILLHFCLLFNKKLNSIIKFDQLLLLLLVIYTVFIFVVLFIDNAFQPAYDFFEPYLYGPLTSSKAIMYVRVWNDMLFDHSFEWLFGTGPGTLASRASNMFSADILAKPNDVLPISSSTWTREYMAGLYDFEVLDNIRWVSAVLTYPFSGFISLKGELGVVGMSMYILTIFKMSYLLLSKSSNKYVSAFKLGLFVAVCTFIVALLFDNYHEQLVISALFFIFIGIFTNEEVRNVRLKKNNYPN
ncbi:hypothetical protein [Vibrio sp. TRT 17S01]|uniref:hypothetical protein n=1 Tax=Vibrio sp. TRT 17S01 TaxID=3418505 RepID=UPI003CE94A4C